MGALAELAGGRADLLAEVAGIFEGTGEGELDEALTRQAAALCRLAGPTRRRYRRGSRRAGGGGRRRGFRRCPAAFAVVRLKVKERAHERRHVSIGLTLNRGKPRSCRITSATSAALRVPAEHGLERCRANWR